MVSGWTIFRVLFYAALLLHHLPLIAEWDQILTLGGNFRSPAYRPDMLWFDLRRVPNLVWFAPYLLVGGVLLGILGTGFRLAALLTLLGVYFFHASNDFGLNVAAVDAGFFVLLVYLVFGAPRNTPGAVKNAGDWLRSQRPAADLIVVYLLTATFCAGLEKIHNGWLQHNVMVVLLNAPPGTVVRGWLYGCEGCRSGFSGWLLTYGTVLLELGLPLLFVFSKTRLLAGIALCAFFGAIQLLLEIPVLFLVLFAGAPLLLLPRFNVNIAK